MELKGNWNYPTPIKFGAGRISELGSNCKDLGIKKPLIVTDPSLAKLPVLQKVQDALKKESISAELFTDLKPNPVGKDVDSGVSYYKNKNCDGVIALGGGSAIDVGKAIALMVGQTRPLFDFEDVGDNYLRVNEKGLAPCIAVPTTAGTGSEVGRASVIIEESTHRKVIIFHPRMLPSRVIADPELTVGLPPFLTAATGIDAFVHCLEAYLSPFYHPIAEGVALQGMKLVHDNLESAFYKPDDLVARSNMLSASMMGATAFQKGLGGVHALAHPIGGMYDTHHGLTNAILLPYVLLRNRNDIEDKISVAGRYLDPSLGSFPAFLGWIVRLRSSLKIQNSLSELNIDDSKAKEIGKMAKEDPSDGGNPTRLTVEDYTEIFQHAVHGKMSV